MKVLLEKLDTVIQSENNGRWVTIKGRHIFVPKGQSIHFDKEGSYKPMTSGEKEAKHQKTVEKTGKERSRIESKYKEKQEKRKKEVGYKEEPSKSIQNKIKRKQEAIKSHISKFQELNKTHKSNALSEFINFIVNILAESQKKKSDLRAPIRSAITRLRQRIKKEKLTNSQKEVILKQIEKLAKEVKELSGDFVGNIFDTTIKTHETENYIRKRQFNPSECEEGTYRTFTIGKGKKAVGCKVKGKFKAQSILEPKKKDLIPLSSFKQIKHDFQEDFTILHGSIVRDGSYDYWDDKGKKYTLYKDWDNLKEVYPKLDYAVVRGTDKKNAHIANEIESFAYNFIPNETTHEIEFDLVLMNDLPTLTKLLNPKEGYHVSPGYTDEVIGNTQYVRKVDHIAISLGNKDQARACTGQNEQGKSCTTVKEVQIHDQNLSEVVN